MARACYTPLYLPASFKGFPFEALEASSDHGRRNATGEFPFSDITGHQDMGRKLRRYSMRVRFAENTHLIDAEAFVRVLESQGPGTLVHPTRGVLRAAVDTVRVSDDIDQAAGVTFVDVDFIEAARWLTNEPFTDDNFLGIDTTLLEDALASDFADLFLFSVVAIHRAMDVIGTTRTTLTNVRNGLGNLLGTAPGRVPSGILRQIDTRIGDDGVLRDPVATLDVISGGFTAIEQFGTPAERFTAARAIANASAVANSSTGPGVAQVENILHATVRNYALIHMGRAALDETPQNLGEAIQRIQIFQALADQELATTQALCTDCTRIELQRFVASVTAALYRRAYGLPPLVSYNFGQPVHALQAAWELYGDARRAPEVISFNPQFPAYAIGPDVIGASR